MSGYGIINRLIIFTTMPGQSIGQGLQPILGFNYGVKRYDRALRVIKIALISAVGFGLLAFSVLYSVPQIFIRIFTTDTELIPMAVYIAKHVFLTVYLTGCIITSIFIFQSLGNAKKSFVITLRPVLFLLPLVLVLPRFFQLNGVALAYPATEALAFMLALILLIPQIREFRRMGLSTKTQVVKPEVSSMLVPLSKADGEDLHVE